MSRVCKKCGGAVKMEDLYCMHCGMPLEKEESVGAEKQNETTTEIMTMGQWLLVLILLAIPVVNIIVAILWIVGGHANPNKKNFAKAWLLLAVIGTILSGILTLGLVQFFFFDHPVIYEEHIEYSVPEEFYQYFPAERNEI